MPVQEIIYIILSILGIIVVIDIVYAPTKKQEDEKVVTLSSPPIANYKYSKELETQIIGVLSGNQFTATELSIKLGRSKYEVEYHLIKMYNKGLIQNQVSKYFL